jgi:hypothetical protein
VLPVIFNITLDYYIRKVKELKREGKKVCFGIEWSTSVSVYANDHNLFRRSMKTMINSQLYMIIKERSKKKK